MKLLPVGETRQLTANEIISYTSYENIKPINNALSDLAENGYIKRWRNSRGESYFYQWPERFLNF